MALAAEKYHKRTNMPHYRPDPLKFDVIEWECVDKHDYGDFLAKQWEKGEAFINLEHDVAPWPGALTEMWECDKPFCAMPLIVHQCVNDTNLGAVKFGAAFIAAHRDLWKEYPRDDAHDWRSLDSWLYWKIEPLRHHRHGPPALHFNQEHLK